MTQHLTPWEIAWLEDELRGVDWGEVRIVVENGRIQRVKRETTTRAQDRRQATLSIVEDRETA